MDIAPTPPPPSNLVRLRDVIRQYTLASEETLLPLLLEEADLGADARQRAHDAAVDFVEYARANANRSGLIDKFLQEYGLSTTEGVTLMRLAEALLRTPDVATADALIRDKVETGDWAAHRGKSQFPLVNFSTNALMLTAAWLDDVEGQGPARQMLRATKSLLDRVGEPVIRSSVAQAMQIMGEHFVLGETIHAALKRARPYRDHGYSFSFDMLGEAARTQADADKFFEDYKNAIAAIAADCRHADTRLNPGISVKLSALHPRYEYGKRERVLTEMGARLKELALDARAANMGFNIDAEEADRLDLSLDMIAMMLIDDDLAGWDGFGVVVQAFQRRAFFVLDWLAAITRDAGRRIMVRLVKGAYWDSEIKRAQTMGLDSYPVFTRKALTDLSYLACARKLFANRDVFYAQFATHNALTATSVREMALDLGDIGDDYEFQRLHGMGEQLHDRLLEGDVRSRIYAPVGGHKELLPYLVRRLLENGANSSFVNQLIDPETSIEEIVASPFVIATHLKPVENPAIPSPRDLFKTEKTEPRRLLAKGRDLTDPNTADRFHPAAFEELFPIAAGPLVVPDVTYAEEPITVRNPANPDQQIGTIRNLPTDAVNDIVAAAGQSSWPITPAKERAGLIRAYADELELEMDRFMAIAVFEAGKSWEDAIAEVREAIDFCRYYAGQAIQLDGEPLGTVICISPWNFPLAIFLGQITANLAAGNCVIAKPAEQTSIIAYEAIRLMHESGIPADAVQLTPGPGESVGAALTRHEAICGVVFTGSTPVAQTINHVLARRESGPAPLIAETGGINAMIVDSTALLEQAVTDVIESAFQSAGQRCSACRVVCVQRDIADRFEEMLAGAMAELTIGDPSDRATDVGPVIDKEAQAVITDYIEAMKKKTRMIAQADIDPTARGTFIAPVAFSVDTLEDVTREVFGPVLHMVRYEGKRLAETVEAINRLGYGLTLGIHTRIDETMHAIVAAARVGNVYVNRNQIGALVGIQPFGGERMSGTGPKAGGPHYVPALTRQPERETKGNIPQFAPPGGHDSASTIDRAQMAFEWWRLARENDSVIKRMTADSNERVSAFGQSLKHWHETLFGIVETLPGPTGESNTLRLKGRGLILCIGDGTDDDTLISKQITLALASGGAALARATPALHELAAGLERAGARPGLLSLPSDLTEDLLMHPHLSAIAFDGTTKQATPIARIVSERDGPLVPVLSTASPERFAVERTLTINTTAAGGDVRLLALEG